VKQNYLRAEHGRANAWLVDFQSTLELAGHWAVARWLQRTALRFVTRENVNAGPNKKYLVQGVASPGTTSFQISTPGSTALSFPAHYATPFLCWKVFWNSRQGSNPVEIMTDTAGASDIIFGLFCC
jgi:TnpA family transposase